MGGGIQSTVMCLLADRGVFGVRPDAAVFADTGWEPQGVYDTVEWLRSEVSFPIITTSNGRSLREDVLNGVNAQGQPWLTIPVFLAEASGDPAGINWRQCTKNYKLDPIQAEVRRLLGVRPRKHLSSDTNVEMWLGITTDEVIRAKPNREWWIAHRFPLIDDRPMSREECLEWFEANYPGRTLERSACVGCPFRSTSSWLSVRESDPGLFEEAVRMDARLRSPGHNASKMFRKQAFLHHRRIPLAEAIRADLEEEEDHFMNECEGHCAL